MRVSGVSRIHAEKKGNFLLLPLRKKKYMKKRNLKKKDALLDTLASTKNQVECQKNDISYSVPSAGHRSRELSSASYCISSARRCSDACIPGP